MAFNILTIRTAEFEDGALYPVLGDERNEIEFEPIDGNNVKVVYATALRVHRQVGTSLVKEVGIAEIKASVYITDSRVAIACTKYDKGGGWRGASLAVPVLNLASKARAAHRRKGKMLVGHVRYPWVAAVGFSEKAGFGTTDQLRFTVNEKIEGVTRKVIFELDFPKGTDVGALARVIAQRTAAYRLRHDLKLADDERAKFQALTQVGPKAPVAKKFVFFEMPTFWFVSKGTAYPKPRPEGDQPPAEAPSVATPDAALSAVIAPDPADAVPNAPGDSVAPPAAPLSAAPVPTPIVPSAAAFTPPAAPLVAPLAASVAPAPLSPPAVVQPLVAPVAQPVVQPLVQPLVQPPVRITAAPVAAPLVAPAVTVASPARWADDPYNRHESRYWDGSVWTEHVADGGVAAIDRWRR